MRHLIRIVAIAGCAMAAWAAVAGDARADTYPVDDPSDLPDAVVGDGLCATASNSCTLRAAIQEANAQAGPDSITLPAGTYTLTLIGQYESSAATGDLDLRDTITLAGAGRGLTVIDGNLADRVFDIFPAASNAPMTATLSGMTLRRGGSVSTGCGLDINGTQTRVFLSQVDIRDGDCLNSYGYGGIYFYNAALLSLSDVTIDNNAGYYGGGLYQYSGQVQITGALISNNAAQLNGGGINSQNGVFSVNRSAVVGNRSGNNGGGLYLYGASGGITNTTVAGNTAGAGGGAYVYVSSGLMLGWSTVAFNRGASSGGGIFADYGGMTMRGTLIGANASVTGPDLYCYGSVTSQGQNLVGETTQCSGGYFTPGVGDLLNVSPGLGALIALSGTRVAPLVYGSPALDGGGAGCPLIDQRGMPRPADGDGNGSAACDIGAYEAQGIEEHSLSGLVYADINLNGVPNAGVDPGIPGVTVTLSRPDSGLVFTASTSSEGGFAFGALASGVYVLRELQPAGFDDGADAIGTAGGVKGNDVMTISLLGATPALSYTFGEYPYATITGTVYADVDGNGAYDPVTEYGVFGVALGLEGVTAGGDPWWMLANADSQGRFSFFPVPPGVYTLTEFQPYNYFDGEETAGAAGGAITGAAPDFDVIAGIPVTYGLPVTGYLFGELPARSVNAHVFLDWNGNGAYEYFESGLGGQNVGLTGITYRGQAVTLTMYTDYFGNANFSGLAPGVYTLTEAQPSFLADGVDRATGSGVAGNDVVAGIALTGSTLSGGASFSELFPGISGVVFIDADADGRYGSESGIGGVTLWLSGTTSAGEGVWMTTTTDVYGVYVFDGLPAGTYALTEDQPAPYLDGFEQAGPSGGITGPVGVDLIRGIVYTPTTVEGLLAAAAGNAFGEITPSSLEGFVFVDSDNNQYLTYYGACPANCDPPLFGVTVILSGVNDAGQGVWMTTTATTGTIQYYAYIGARYAYTSVRPGVYSLIELQPESLNDGPMENGTPYARIGVNRFDAITLTPGTQAGRYNFGEYPAALSGYVYRDTNNDGVYQRYAQYPLAEDGLSGVGVSLTYRTITGAVGTSVTQTDNRGRYAFTGLVTGTYTLTELQPNYYADGRESIPILPATVGNDLYAGIAYTPGVAGDGFNFGEVYPAGINVAAYFDRNANGVFDGNDVRIYNTTFALTGVTEAGSPVGPIVLNSGPYSFDVTFNNLSPGVYSIVETQPAGGYVDGVSVIGSFFGGVPGANRIDGIAIITPGITAYGYAFTELRTGISGFVYRDGNNNRLHDDTETSISGQATVVLSGSGVLSNTLSGYDGYYLFTNVPSGVYQITAAQLGSYLDNFDQPGTINGVPSGVSGALGTDIISGIVYPATGVGVNYDFGEVLPSHIRGTVYQDLNTNGVYDISAYPYENGLRYVTVTLTGADDVGAPVRLTRVTDIYGAFDFDTLRPGLYTLTETQPAGYADGRERNGFPPAAVLADDRFEGITITMPGADLNGYTFGELLNGLYGYVFLDGNNDGANFGGSDGGINNAQVVLSGTTIFGQSVFSVTYTDSFGRFIFSRLVTGTYTLSETQPVGYLDGIDTPGSLGGITATLGSGVDLISGIVVTDASYGRDYLFGELRGAQINGYVYLDLNSDGYKSFSEPGVFSVTLALTGTNDRGQPVAVVTRTDSFGQFFFVDLRPGIYTLREEQPAGYLDGLDRNPAGALSLINDTFGGLALASGQTLGQYLFAESGGFVSGFIYGDRNNDGVRAITETGIANATVHLTGTRSDTGAIVGRVTQSAFDGVYQFVNLPNGTYTITEVQPAGWFDGRETLGTGAGGAVSGNDRFVSVTMSGPGGINYNFGEIGPSSFGGVVFFDKNDNGVRDADDPGILGAALTLRGTDYLSAPVWMTATTTLGGSFSFTNVRSGTYTVSEMQPAGYLDGKDFWGCCRGGALGNDVIAGLSLGGEDYAAAWFGERISGLSGYAYRDYNNNGLRDDGADAYSGLATLITLHGQTALGQLITRTMSTDAFGFYFFNDLPAGTYRLVENQPANTLDGRDTPGSLGGATGANDEIAGISFLPGQYGSEYNFGELMGASIDGSVYWDLNNDGQMQSGEPGIAGVTVVLSGTDDLNQRARMTATTIGGGAFAFGNLRPGTYSLLETQPANYTDGIDTPGNYGGTADGRDGIHGIALASAQQGHAYLFGERQNGLTGYVYRDLNNDGLRQGPDESGIPDVLISLSGTTVDGAALYHNTVTNIYGFYTFGDLLSGTYRLSEYPPPGFFDGRESLGTLGGLQGEDVFTLTYVAGQYGSEYNFGELPPATLSGQVFHDLNNDGVRQAQESGIPAAFVWLTGLDDLGGGVTRLAQTSGYGYYTIGSLRPGVYTLTELQPAGYVDGQDKVGSLGGALVPTDSIAGIAVGVNGNGYGYDFGETQTGLSGYVYIDANADGAREAFNLTDQPINGVTLILTGTTGGAVPITRTAQTDVYGFYSFGDLPAGQYRIREIQPPAYLDGRDQIGTLGGSVGPLGQDFFDVDYPGGVFGLNYNFGEYPPNTLRGYVFFDIDDNGGDGQQDCPPYELPAFCGADPERPEISVGAGVKIVLDGRNDLGERLLMTDTTSSVGQFSFPLLRPGIYTLTEIQRDVDVDGKDKAVGNGILGNDQVREISLTVGQTQGAVFGEKPSITGYVYRDDNDNGLHEPDRGETSICVTPEVGIGRVNLQLTGVDVYNRNVTLNTTSFYPPPPPDAIWRCYEGFYFWGGLVTGTYDIREFQPAGYLDGRETAGTGGGLTTTNDIIARIVFTPGVVITGYNFAEQRNVIGGNVYVDTNGNGIFDSSFDGRIDTPATILLTGINNLGQAVAMSRTTLDAYQFSDLRPGVYTITEIQPAGYADGQEQLGVGAGGQIGANDQFVNLVLTPGALAAGYNFGELTTSSVGGRVAYIWGANGYVSLGRGLVSQTLRLDGALDAGGSVLLTTTTDASGYYLFTGLAPGRYTVTHVNFPMGYRDFGVTVCHYQAGAQGRAIAGIPLQYGNYYPNCDFKLGPTLTGFVFADDNANGALDVSEAGIEAVRVSAYGVLENGALTTQTVSTVGGLFAFGGLLTGTYWLGETQPRDFYDGLDVAGSLGGMTGTAAASALPAWSPPISDDIIAGIVYTPNALGQNYLFAELRPAEIRGHVYYDKDDTGTFTPCCIPPHNGQDEVISPVRVVLDGIDDLGARVLMTNPDGGGILLFSGLRPGVYTLTETQPPTYTDWIDTAGTKGGALGPDQIRFINLTWGDVASGYTFGERKFGIIGNVFADRDNNGTFFPSPDGPDDVIAGASILLSGTTALGAPVLLTTTTNDAGAYSFPDLQPGVYTLSETQPAGYADGLDHLGTLGGVLSNDRVTGIVVGDHSFGERYDFGELPVSTLSGYVYVDANNDGYRAGYGEPGIPGVTITLQGQNTLGDPVLMVTRTDAFGYYLFRAIPNGSYSLIETQPNFVDGIDRAGSRAGGVALDDVIIGIGFTMLVDAIDYNFGERPSALSGHVFWDENGSATREISETGLSPATLRLRGVDFNSQPVNKTTKTTFDGYYAFEALPGTYWIEEIQPFGYLNGLAIPGTLGGVISGPNIITSIVVGIGGAGSDYDFGEVAPTAVDLAQAMGVDLAFLQAASLQVDRVNKAGVGAPETVGPLPGTATLAGFPTDGAAFAYLGTGNMLFADQPNSSPNSFGLGDYARLVLTVTVPTTATCMSMDFAFFSEEFPEFVGSQFNDNFDAYVDGQPVARDQNGNRISINAVFGATPANAAGTTYDAATPRLRAQAELTPGATSVISFTITDVSDTAYDSAVFIDKLKFTRPGGQGCAPGANLPVGIVLTKTVGLWPEAGNPVCALTDAITLTQPAEIAYCYRATNTGEYTLTSHTLADSALGPIFNQMPLALLPGETFEFIASRVETRTTVSVASWTGYYSGTFSASSTDVATVTFPAPIVTPTPTPGSAALMVSPGSAQTYFTQPITVAVMISGVSNLGGYEAALRFDPSQVTATQVSQGGFLTETGRTLIPLPTRFGPDYVRFGASTIGPAPGPGGSGVLAWVRIAPRGVGSATLALSNTLATNVAGLSINLSAQDGQLYVIHPGAAYLPRVLR